MDFAWLFFSTLLMPSHQFNKLSVGNKDNSDGAYIEDFYPVSKWKDGSVWFEGLSWCFIYIYIYIYIHTYIHTRWAKARKREERRQGWVGRRNNKNANDLRSGRSDKVIRTGYTNKKVTQDVEWLFFHYLHLPLRLIGRSMQTCK